MLLIKTCHSGVIKFSLGHARECNQASVRPQDYLVHKNVTQI